VLLLSINICNIEPNIIPTINTGGGQDKYYDSYEGGGMTTNAKNEITTTMAMAMIITMNTTSIVATESHSGIIAAEKRARARYLRPSATSSPRKES